MSSVASYMQANTAHELDRRYDQGISFNDNNNNYLEDDEKDNNYEKNPKKFRLRLSKRLHYTAELAFASYILLMISFASPYWLSSYKFTDSAFKRLGLWDFCFQEYRHPSYQYDYKFTGCHWIYSSIFTNIRDWLQPPWFMFVQAVTTIALCISTIGLTAISIIFMHFLIQYQLIILCTALICHMLTTMLLGFALITFYLKAFDRSWIMYPEFNHVDWAFFFALFSMIGNGFSSYLYHKEVQTLKERLSKMKHLIVTSPSSRSMIGPDGDSIDAVYASRSTSVYQAVGNESQRGNRPNQSGANNNKNSALMYPYYTQV